MDASNSVCGWLMLLTRYSLLALGATELASIWKSISVSARSNLVRSQNVIPIMLIHLALVDYGP